MRIREGVTQGGAVARPAPLARGLRGFLKLMGCTVFAMLAGTGTVLGNLSPFGVSVVAAMEPGLGIGALFGSAIGYLLNDSVGSSMKYIAAGIAVFALKWLVGQTSLGKKVFMAPAAAFFSLFSANLAVYYTMGELGIYNIVLALSEASLCAGAAFFIWRGLDVAAQSSREITSENDIASLVIMAGIALLSLSSIETAGVSLTRVLSVLMILVSALCWGEKGGSIMGISCSVVVCLADPSMAFVAGAYGFGGLLAGMFSSLSKFGCAAAFVLANAVSALVLHASGSVLAILYETMIATVLFMLLPVEVVKKLPFLRQRASCFEKGDSLKNAMSVKIGFASRALLDVSRTVEQVTSKLSAIGGDDVLEVYTRASRCVCKDCRYHIFCWETLSDDTLRAFDEITPILQKNGSISKSEMPAYFISRCARIADLTQAVNQQYASYQAKDSAERRVMEVRTVIADQFDGMSTMLREFGEELCESGIPNEELSKKVRLYLSELRYPCRNALVTADKNGRITLEIVLEGIQEDKIDAGTLSREMSDLCSCRFEEPIVTRAGRALRYVLTQRARYRVDFGASQLAFQNSDLCGDAYDYFVDAKNRAHLLISDGMGSGGRAAVDSAMAVALLGRLIKAGFSFDASLKMVNSALLVKSGEESLATIDVTSFDLFTGETEVLKAGAAPTFILHGGKVYETNSNSLPAGILRGVSFDKKNATLGEGDMLIMVSDGATAIGNDWIKGEIERYQSDSAQQLAARIAEDSKRRRTDGHDDDVTVLVAKIQAA